MVAFLLIFLLKVHVQPASGTCFTVENETVGKDQYTECLFYRARSTAAFSHRRPVSAATSRDGFGAEDTTEDTPCMCNFNVAAS